MQIGIDLGGTKIEGIALGVDGAELGRIRVPTPADDYDGTVRAIANVVAELEQAANDRGSVGIGTPGARSPATGLMKNANSTCLNGRPLREDLERTLDRPISMANDANCFALSEATDGAGADARVVFGVILGTGVGGGIVVDGRVLEGRNAIAGEWGHTPLPWPRDEERPGPACYCGRSGCLETFVSGPGIAAAYTAATGEACDAVEIARRAETGDPTAIATLDHAIDRLARGLATVVNVLDPDVIVLGGGLSNVVRIAEGIPRGWTQYVFSDRVDTPVRRAMHGDSSGVRGAAWLGGRARVRPPTAR
ncbi:MAG: ROK family protein [Phycisphaerae bacterium]|nr:ROK family protein [Phycisphaerae bacterium]NNF42783.1 ROK family protein [Phycisphaerales bacterium]